MNANDRKENRFLFNPPSHISSWGSVINRLKPEAWPEFTPSFKLMKGDKIFTIGSCFARNIEDILASLGFDIPMRSFSVPKEERAHIIRPNGILNKYTPPAIFQMINWCEGAMLKGGKVEQHHIDKLMYSCGDGKVIDLHIGGYTPVTRERALERRQDIYDVISNIFRSAGCGNDPWIH